MQNQALSDEMRKKVQAANEKLSRLKKEIAKKIVGQKRLVDRLIIALLAGGHVLLEGVPGIAKTLAVNTLADALALDFKRIQFTPDLLPSDLIGTSIYNPKEGTFSVQKGPLFTNVVLGDEINRAPPKVQSALLEVMQEKQITISGETFKTGSPFFVLGTQNPIEQEGTYPLPEAQTDRFMMKIVIGYPTIEEEKEIVSRVANKEKMLDVEPQLSGVEIIALRELVSTIYLDEKVLHYITSIVFETRKKNPFLEYGASPRASINLAACARAHALLENRGYVTPYDVQEVLHDVLRHRLVLSYEALAKDKTRDAILDDIIEAVEVP